MERDNRIIDMYVSGKSLNEIITTLNISKKTIYRVLKKHNIRLRKVNPKKCVLCGKKSIKNLCGTCNTNLRRYRVKKRSVEYLGGKCKECGWFGDISGFDFHHKDPTKKDFSPNGLNLANKSWERAKKELDKCELLCALCHRKKHSVYDQLEELSKKYKGREFKD